MGVHHIYLHNKSGSNKDFEVHGWNNNRNVTVGPNQVHVFDAPDQSSGAIIALHDGHECEQVEISKDGYGGMCSLTDLCCRNDGKLRDARKRLLRRQLYCRRRRKRNLSARRRERDP